MGTLVHRVNFLKERVAAGQIAEEDLYIPMHGFDYSVVSPLVNSGHFHSMLGAEGVVSRNWWKFSGDVLRAG